MSAKPETTFIASVHRHLPATLYHMKNHNQYVSGLADCWYSGHTTDLWIEYKFIEVPKRADTVIDLVGGKSPYISYLQQDWLKSRHAEGRNVGVLVGSKQGGAWFPDLSWDCTYTAAEYLAVMKERKHLANTIINLVE
jgi:hypothetical protein